MKTTNGRECFGTTNNVILDLFSRVGTGAINQSDLVIMFREALKSNVDLAVRLMLHVRDVRGGMGRRDPFWVMFNASPVAVQQKVLHLLPELGYWKDIRKVIEGETTYTVEVRKVALQLLAGALREGNGLAAKYTPRKGIVFNSLRNVFKGISPKDLRKMLVSMTKVVEQQMCAKDWGNINYSSVPSKAMVQYRKAFGNHDAERFEEFKTKASTGEVKVNAGAVFIHQIAELAFKDPNLAEGMWKNLPNCELENVLCIADASSSMTWFAHDNVEGRRIAAAMSLYFSERCSGEFKDHLITFESNPSWVTVESTWSLSRKLREIESASWGGSTDLSKVFDLILSRAVRYNAPQSAMPTTLLIFSDMQFNEGVSNLPVMEEVTRKFKRHGYSVPKIVFWNLNGSSSVVHATSEHQDVALLSGFSIASAKALMDGEDFSPVGVMLKTLMSPRYSWQAEELG